MPSHTILGRFPLAPLAKGGNLPFRRLCREFGATSTCSEMIYAKQLVKGSRMELALLRHHPTEDNFGVQFAAKDLEIASEACRRAEQLGVRFIELNCGCPIHEAVRRGVGSRLLQKPTKLGRLLAAMVNSVQIPVLVKLRLGYAEEKLTISSTVQAAVDAGVSGITIHGRTREQRYSRAADWEAVREMAELSPVPVWGNGDILTHFEAEDRMRDSKIAGAMVARGALVKPWIFRELQEGREWLPSPEQFWQVIVRFTEYLKEYFGSDELGRRRGVGFLAWQLDWFSRYRPLPASTWLQASREHPLLQTRSLGEPLLRLPDRTDEAGRQALAERIWESRDPGSMWESLASETPEPIPERPSDLISSV